MLTGQRRSRYIGGICAILLLVTGGAAPARAGGPAPVGLTHLTLQLKWLPQAQFAGYFVASDMGFYRQQGLDVTIKPGGPNVTPERVVRDGRADIGVDWLSALLVARDRGANLVNIAQIFQASGMRLITFKTSGISSISGLRGKRVGVWFGGNEYPFYALASKYQMSPPERYITVVKEGFTMQDFLSHQIDAAHAMTYNELGMVLEHGVTRSQLRIFDYNRLGVSLLEDGLFARGAWLRSHRDVAARFLHASIEGWQWAVAHPDRAGAIAYRHEAPGYSTLAHQIYQAREVAKLITHGPGAHHTIGYMSPRLFARTWHILLNQHVIRAAPAGAYDQSYWRGAGGT